MTAEQLKDAGIYVSLDAGDNGNLDEVADAEPVSYTHLLPFTLSDDEAESILGGKDSPLYKQFFKVWKDCLLYTSRCV